MNHIVSTKAKVLITGGAGYLGSILVPALLGEGYQVTVLDRFTECETSLLACCSHPQFRAVRGDCREESVVSPLMAAADYIIPLAALVGAPLCAQDPISARTINVDAVRLLLRLRSSEQRIVFPCTNSGYGIGEPGKFCTEETPMRPISLYGVTKVESESAVLDAGNCVTFRLATVFGTAPRMRIDLLVNDFVHRAVTDRAVVIFEGHAKRNYIHIRDVTRAMLHSINQFDTMRDRPYNVGLSDANLSKLELCAKIQEHLPRFVYLEAPIGEDPDKRDYIVSNARIESTGFMPQYSLDFGIDELRIGYTMLRNSKYSNV
jgi:nucleoside-diphosphate-sugar epimerase